MVDRLRPGRYPPGWWAWSCSGLTLPMQGSAVGHLTDVALLVWARSDRPASPATNAFALQPPPDGAPSLRRHLNHADRRAPALGAQLHSSRPAFGGGQARLRNATHSAVVPQAGGRLRGPDGAQVEPREVDGGRRAVAPVGHRVAGSPRSRSPGHGDAVVVRRAKQSSRAVRNAITLRPIGENCSHRI